MWQTVLNWAKRHKVISGFAVMVLAMSAYGNSLPDKHPRDASVSASSHPSASPSATIAPAGVRLAASRLLQANIASYRSAISQATSILLSAPPYGSAEEGLQAMNDPRSAASRYRDFRAGSKVLHEMFSEAVFEAADKDFTAGDEPQAISDWRNTMLDVGSALTAWIELGASYQIGDASRASLLRGKASLLRLLQQAEAEAAQVGQG